MQQPVGYRVLRRIPATEDSSVHLVADPRAPDGPPLVLVRAAAGTPAAVTDHRIAALGALEGQPLAPHVQRLVDLVPGDGDGDGVGLVLEHLADRLGPTDGRSSEARRAAVERIAEVVAALHRAGWTHGAIGLGAIAWRGAVPVLVDLDGAAPATAEGVRDDRAALEAMVAVVAATGAASADGGQEEREGRLAPRGTATEAVPRTGSPWTARASAALPVRTPLPRRALDALPRGEGRSRAAHRGGRRGAPSRVRMSGRRGLAWALGAGAAVLLLLLVAVSLIRPGSAEAVVPPATDAGEPTLGPLPADPLAAVDALLAHREACGAESACLAQTTQEASPARAADDAGATIGVGRGPSVLLDETGGAVIVERPGAIVIAMDTRAGRRIRAVIELSD